MKPEEIFKTHNICGVCGKTKQTFSGAITYIGEYPFCQCGINMKTRTASNSYTVGYHYKKEVKP
jgi:hypothetical protein